MRNKGRDVYGWNFGENNGQAVLKETDVMEIKHLLATGEYTQEELGKIYGVTRGAIKAIKLGETWRHLNATR